MGHFEMDRIDAKKTRVEADGSKFKKQNVAQQTKQQQLQPAITGLIPYGKLVKARNMEDLRIEFLFRGVPEEEIPKKISDQKAKLKQLEFNRLLSFGMEGKAASEQAKKYFMKLSTAPFKLNADWWGKHVVIVAAVAVIFILMKSFACTKFTNVRPQFLTWLLVVFLM